MPNKQNKYIGPLRQGQIKAERRDWNVIKKAKKAMKKAAKPKKRVVFKAKAMTQMRAPGHRANVKLPVGADGLTIAAGRWPQTYFRRGGPGGDNSARFCVPIGRYGCDKQIASTLNGLPGGAAFAYIGTTAKWTQMLPLGPGWSLLTPGSSIATYDQMLWINSQLGWAAMQYSQYKMKRMKFHFVPTNATTASARSMWAAFFPDPAIACTEGYSAGTFSLSTIQSASDAVCFPAWQTTVLHAKIDPSWKNVNQPFADGTSGSTGVALYGPASAYLQLHSFGTLAMVIDYTNAGGAPIIDGYVFAEGEVEFKEPSPQLFAPAAPAVDLQGCRRARLIQEQVPQAETKTLDPATTLDPLAQPPVHSRDQMIAFLTAKLSELQGNDLEVVVEDDYKSPPPSRK